jgi:hypothetical protein
MANMFKEQVTIAKQVRMMRKYLYTDWLAAVAACISLVALAMMSDRASEPAAIVYAVTAPTLTLPSG